MFRKILLSLLALLPITQACSQTAPQEHLTLPNNAQAELARIAAMPKFEPDGMLYTGIADPALRATSANLINTMVADVATGIRKHPEKGFVLGKFRTTLAAIKRAGVFDTEDREAAAKYCEMIMDAVGLESSDGLLNNWVYGFDPDKLQKP